MADTFLTDPALIGKDKKVVQFKKQFFSLQDDEVEINVDEQDREKRKWQSIQQKISFLPKPDDYYKDKLVKPGYFFYKTLLNVDPSKLNDIYINIPTTLMTSENTYQDTYVMLYTNEQGKFCKNESTWIEFDKHLLDENKVLTNKFKKIYSELRNKERKFNDRMNLLELVEKINAETNQDTPFIISRGPMGDQTLSKCIYSYRQQKERKSNYEQKIEQRYIISRPLRACILRLVYHTKNCHSMAANYGYRILNKKDIFDPDTKKPLTKKCCLDSEVENSYDIQLVKGSGLLEYEKQAQQIVKLVERNNNVRIEQIVLDFIQDIEGKIWFFNCKSIHLQRTLNMSDYIAGSGEEIGQQGKKTLDQLTCSVYCKLCGIKFKKDDASKVLTYKLLWELVQHLKKRNIYLQKIKVSHSSTRPCRVCNLCYMLIVGEHELIEIEQKFARAQNVPMQDEVIRVPIDTKPKHRPALLSETLNQWRLLFYFQYITDIEPIKNVELKNLHIQYKLHNFRSCFKTTQSVGLKPAQQGPSAQNDNQSKNSHFKSASQPMIANIKSLGDTANKSPGTSFNIYQIRVHYFFSEDKEDHEDLNIEKFLAETEIKVRLTNGEEWGQFIAEGSSKTISHFQNKVSGGQRHTSQVLLFFESSNYCTLTLSAGLVCDGKYNTGKLNLYKYNDVYFPDENYYNCNPFPDEWMEMFDKNYVSQKDEISDSKNNEKYSPKCTKAELNTMIDFNSKQKSRKYIHVQSQVKEQIKGSNLQLFQMNNFQLSHPQSAKNLHQPSNILPDNTYGIVPQTAKMSAQNNQSDLKQLSNLQLSQPRALTAKKPPLLRNQSDFAHKMVRPMTTTSQLNHKQFRIPKSQNELGKSSGSHKFLLNQKNKFTKNEERSIQKQYDMEMEENDSEEVHNISDEDSQNESTDEILREKLLQHYKKQNKTEEQTKNQNLGEKQAGQKPDEFDNQNQQSVGSQALLEFLNQKKIKLKEELAQPNPE